MKKSRYKEMLAERHRRRGRTMSPWLAAAGYGFGLVFVLVLALSLSNRIAWGWHVPQPLTFGPLAALAGFLCFYRRPLTPARRNVFVTLVVLILLITGGLLAAQANLSQAPPTHQPH